MRLIIASLLLLAPFAAAAPGVSVDAEGRLVKDGAPLHAVGVNYFNCFLRTLHDGNDTSYDKGFAALAELKIPFARFAACGFWPADMNLYFSDKPEYFRRLDGVIESARRHNIGLIPSLFWHWSTLPDLAGEPCDQWGNPQSRTHALMRQYVADLVTRYRESPVIWGWEMGNEFNLPADLPDVAKHRPQAVSKLGTPATRSSRDRLTSDALRVATEAFAKEVRRHDPHRFITTGNSIPRPSSWHLWKEGKWTNDSTEQLQQILQQQHPAPINVLSIHYYGKDTWQLKDLVAAARTIKQPLFVGEFNVAGEPTPQTDEAFTRMLDEIRRLEIPLAALWVYDFPPQDKQHWNVTATNRFAHRLKQVAKANQPR